MTLPVVMGITGASGAPYARRLLEVLVESGQHVLLISSAPAMRIWEQEIGGIPPGFLPSGPGSVEVLDDRDIGAAPASGSFRHRGMVVCPCSMRTLAAISHGLADSLLTRSADVTLKERRPLLLVTRETPLGLVHIENMARVTRSGAMVLPAEPGFYHRPRTIQDLLDFVVQRVLDQLRIEHVVAPRWGTGTATD